ncbi:MAG: hypothetical protein M3R49_07345 [Chloroflexota bacterium]|nr:hypothetical protein [Chloroflexota bacterium]
MSIEALPFVNWIFWAALSAGTLFVVGLTELLGGTTRGYRLFMAWLLMGCAAILLLSDLNLPGGVAAARTADLRRPLVVLFLGGNVIYLAAQLVGSHVTLPRGAIAVATSLVGFAAMLVLALAGATDGVALFAGQLILAALALGAVNAAMLLGHWYLVTPQLSPRPLRRMMWLLIGALVLQAAAFGAALMVVGGEPLKGTLAWLTWLRLIAGTLLPIGITVLAILASRAASLQASTGLLYIGLALVIAGLIAGASITYLTGVPV